MRYVFLLNRFSLKDKLDGVLNRIDKYAKSMLSDYVIEINNEKVSTEDILDKYKNEECVVFAIGGDGSVHRVVNKIQGTKNILGVVPYGTGNDFYKAERECLKPGINDVDLVKINDDYFINVACFGIDAKIGNQEAVVHSKLIPASQRYNAAIIKSFSEYKPIELKIQTPEEEIEGRFATVVVGNARYYGGGYCINPYGNPNDGLLDVLIPGDLSKLEVIKFILGTKKGKHMNYDKLKYLKTDKITIISENAISANVDVERYTAKKFDISICPNKLRVYYNDDITRMINDKNQKMLKIK